MHKTLNDKSMNQKTRYKIWMATLLAMIFLGLICVFRIFTEGHSAVFHADDAVPWTLLIAAYIFFVLTSTGVTFVSSLALVFNREKYYPIAKRCVFIAIAALVAGFIAMGLELGKPLNMIYYIIYPNPISPIWWMGVLYLFYLVLLLLKFYMIHQNDWNSKKSKIIGIATFICAVAAHSTLGSVFGLIEARPTFFGEYMPIYFLLSALLSGLATVCVIILLQYKVTKQDIPEPEKPAFESISRIFAFVIFIAIIFSIWRTITGLFANRPEYDVMGYLVDSIPFKVEVLFGLIIPLTLMLVSKIRLTTLGKIIAGFLVLVGLGIGRMDLVMTGQMLPIMPKINIEQSAMIYFPTIWEWIICVFSGAVMLFIYTLGDKYLNLDAAPKIVYSEEKKVKIIL